MPIQTCTGGTTMCTFGMAPGTFVATPKMVMTGYMPAANIMDHVPMVNIMPHGMCACPANPMVAAATALASGVLTPQPCIPVTPAPWMIGSPTVILSSTPALNNTSTLMCIWGGTITFANPGQVTEMIP